MTRVLSLSLAAACRFVLAPAARTSAALVSTAMITALAVGSPAAASPAPDAPSPDADEVWVTMGEDAFDILAQQPGVVGRALPLEAVASRAGVVVTRLPVDRLPAVSELMHDAVHRCAGFAVHASLTEATDALTTAERGRYAAPLASLSVSQQATVGALQPLVDSTRLRDTIEHLSTQYNNRYYQNASGQQSALWIRDLWQGYAAGRSDVTVSTYSHGGYVQPSVILTIDGSGPSASEAVVLGGHLDSIISGSVGTSTVAPGADDNASGIAALSEIIRVLLQNGFAPDRTVHFMGYAAEEVGLRGSGDIAADFLASSTDVVAVLQLDMTAYNGSAEDIAMADDYTSASLTAFVGQLVDAYQPSLQWTTTSCGYACSDHASWHNRGYPAAMPHEARLGQNNPTIHTSNDTLQSFGSSAAHVLKFARLGLAFAVETGLVDAAPPSTCSDCIDWSTTGTVSYSNQDVDGNVSVADGGDTLVLAGNTWRRTTQTFAVTPQTVLEVDFSSASQGEIHGIGFDENDTLSDAVRIFQLHGTQNWTSANHDFDDYSGSGVRSYRIPVGQYYTGSAMRLVLVGDNDAGSGGEGRFRNVRIVEDGSPPGGSCSVEVDFESGASGFSNTAGSTCSTGAFVVATPTQQTSSGVVTQVGGDHTSGSGNALFTATNSSAGANDVDGGVCIVQSPVYSVAEASQLSVWTFHGQRDAGDDAAGDFFRLEISRDGGTTYQALQTIGDVRTQAAWGQVTASVAAGDQVRLRLQVSDAPGAGDLIEGGLDDLSICPVP